MMRSAVSFPPSFEATALVTIVSGISAVSALEASAIARSKPAIRWKRLTTRRTKLGRSQNVSVWRTRWRSISMDKGLETYQRRADERNEGRLRERDERRRSRHARAREAVQADQADPGPLGERERGLVVEDVEHGEQEEDGRERDAE